MLQNDLVYDSDKFFHILALHTSNTATPYVGECCLDPTIKLQINTIKSNLMVQKISVRQESDKCYMHLNKYNKIKVNTN